MKENDEYQHCEECRNSGHPWTDGAEQGMGGHDFRYWCGCPQGQDMHLADLEAENERLKCCGNCTHIDHGWYDEGDECAVGKWTHTMPSGQSFETNGVACEDPCHFTPSRWTPDVRPICSRT